MTIARFSPLPALQVHPGAWWLWALACAFLASIISNAVALALLCVSITTVGLLRISAAERRFNFQILIRVAMWFVGLRIVLQTLLGYPMGSHVFVKLPTIDLPTWLSGLRLGGVITWESLLNAATEGLRMGAIVLAFAAATNLTSTSKVLRNLPVAFHEVGMIIIIAITFIPHLFSDAQRLIQAARWRGQTIGRMRLLVWNVVSLCEAALDRSNALAGSLTTRGYGIHSSQTKQRNLVVAGLAIVAASAVYFLFTSQGYVSIVVAALGVACSAVGMKQTQSLSTRTQYRPDVWQVNENYFAAITLAMTISVVLYRDNLQAFAFDSTLNNLVPTHFAVLVFIAAAISPLLVTIASPHQELVRNDSI
ncbi:MAG: hypothetical protein RIS75_602 [Actinomycetota bacterium]